MLWRVWAANASSGHKRLLSSNGNTPDPFVPQVHASDGYVFWTQAEADRTAREYIWKVGSGAPRAALRHVEMTPGSETAADGKLVYLSRAAGRHKGHTVGGDCWAVPLDGHGPAKPLTHTALALGCAAHAGRLVWFQHIDPSRSRCPRTESWTTHTRSSRASSTAQSRRGCIAATCRPGTPSSGTAS